MGRVYAVVSAKGGVGKTTTTANLAAALAAAGADVAVVDGDLGMANLAGALGVAATGPTLHDVLAGDAEVGAATYEGPHGMAVVPGATDLDAFARADPEGLRDVLAELADRYDYVLLDTGAGLSNDTVVPLTYVDEALLVSTTGRDALGDTEKTRQVADRLGVPVAGAVLTRVDPADFDPAAVAAQFDAEVLRTIPDDAVVRRAGDAGEPLTTFAPGSSAAAAYRGLAADLTGESVPRRDADAADGESDDVPEDGDAATDDEASAEASPEDDPDSDDIIVAGEHEGDAPDGDPEDAAEDDSDASSASAESLVEAAEPDADVDEQIPFADREDEPATEDGAADEGETDESPDETDGPTRDGAADDDAGDESDGESAGPEGADADADAADDADDAAGEDAEEEGVYTTELGEDADGAPKSGGDRKKKGLFGRFLG
jgi:septum site-determining protein MinD